MQEGPPQGAAPGLPLRRTPGPEEACDELLAKVS